MPSLRATWDKSVSLLLLLLTCWLCSLGLTEAGTVTASGGGLIKPGEDLELTNTMTEEWDRCYWYW